MPPPIQPFRVLLVSPLPPPVGGIASWTVNVTSYYESLQKSNLDLILCDSSSKGRRITSRSHSIRIYHGIINSLKTYWKVKKFLQEKPDVVHLVSSASFSLVKDILIIRLARRRGVPVITHWRFGRIPALIKKNNWEYKLLSKVIKKSTYSIVIDQTSYNALLKQGFNNVLNMPNPIAADVGSQTKTLVDAYQTRPSDAILYVGHVVRGKGVYELVHACVQNHKLNRLTLIGPYEEETKAALMDIAKKRNDGNWIEFLGSLEKSQVLEKMKAYSILALPSYTEGFPNVVLEAMAMGCAVVGTYVGAIPEMLDIETNHPCGVCVSHQNIEDLTNAIDLLVGNTSKIEVMAKNGLKKVLNSYSMERVFAEYLQHWENASDKNL
ncbi:glycosyltransferase family 4 protein [Maribacter sp. 2308TA10-17]|uniref:glycosyltransferase family 4 protein n=1 Tax=Maribacter sp. 2308TA10-17 TaxID=3386276 RepID=UPI0039BCA0A0